LSGRPVLFLHQADPGRPIFFEQPNPLLLAGGGTLLVHNQVLDYLELAWTCHPYTSHNEFHYRQLLDGSNGSAISITTGYCWRKDI